MTFSESTFPKGGEAVLLAKEFGVARIAAVDGPLDILLQTGRPVEDHVAGGVALEGVFPDHVSVEVL